MPRREKGSRLGAAALLLALVAMGCATTGRKPLPSKVPETPVLEETGPEAGWPPQVKGATNIRIVPWEPIPGTLTDSLEAQMREAALHDGRVRQVLGTRFAFLRVDEIESLKGMRRRAADPVRARVSFFSYENNIAVQVTMVGTRVDTVARREGYEPPEGQEEIKAAVALAQRDTRLSEKVEGLRGVAILAFLPQERSGPRNRILHVSFIKDDDDLPLFMALVDLTADKVLSAGPVERRR